MSLDTKAGHGHHPMAGQFIPFQGCIPSAPFSHDPDRDRCLEASITYGAAVSGEGYLILVNRGVGAGHFRYLVPTWLEVARLRRSVDGAAGLRQIAATLAPQARAVGLLKVDSFHTWARWLLARPFDEAAASEREIAMDHLDRAARFASDARAIRWGCPS